MSGKNQARDGPEIKQPPLVKVSPQELVGNIVQIALSRDQLGNPTLLIPPLRVVRYVESTDHNAQRTYADIEPWHYFLGTPLKDAAQDGELARDFSRESLETSFLFYSTLRPLQPHFCLDNDFLDYLESEKEWIPVEVYGANAEASTPPNEVIADKEGFRYIDFGVLQMFIPDRGFVSPWPERYPHIGRIAMIEKVLLKHSYAKRDGGGV